MVLNVTFNNISMISWRSVLVVTGKWSTINWQGEIRKHDYLLIIITSGCHVPCHTRGRRRRDRMMVGYTTTCAISTFYH
jgi:hypothetical protein